MLSGLATLPGTVMFVTFMKVYKQGVQEQYDYSTWYKHCMLEATWKNWKHH
jgi:hypothetical protein